MTLQRPTLSGADVRISMASDHPALPPTDKAG